KNLESGKTSIEHDHLIKPQFIHKRPFTILIGTRSF
ncbi:MAG: hypothetical protein ACJA1B_001221, partial [Polaribacter sp.]